MKRKHSLQIILAPLVIAVALVVGIIIGRYFKNPKKENIFYIYPRTDKLNNVINYIERQYVDTIDRDKLIENAIPKIVSELDPHSEYIPASELKAVNEPLEGNFSGIGVQFTMLNDTLVVLKTITNGPSEKIGVLAGDRIIVVGKDTVAGKKMPSDSIVSRLKGPRGTEVTIEVSRKKVNKLLSFDIIRDNIPLYSLDAAYMIRPGIGFIKLNKFSRTTFDEFSDAVIKLTQQGMTKLIFDLRGNGGGFLDASVHIADQFLDQGKLIVYTVGRASPRWEFRATKGGLCLNVDLAVLIDEGTASASEIFAGAMQDNDRGTIIGRRSFGKGLVQEQNVFPDGSALRLTIARYYTPTGRCIQKPYKKGDEQDYYNELSNRYLHGEMMQKDSIRFTDSLRYVTPGGKVVYGGGGIMPDIFVPIDTIGITNYLMNIRSHGLIYRFALEYTENNRSDLKNFTDVKTFEAFLDQHKVFPQFISFAAKNEIPVNQKEINKSKEILKTQLYAAIIRNMLDNDGFYPAIEPIDNTLLKAIDVLNSDKK